MESTHHYGQESNWIHSFAVVNFDLQLGQSKFSNSGRIDLPSIKAQFFCQSNFSLFFALISI